MNNLRKVNSESLIKSFKDDSKNEIYHVLKSNNNGGDAEFIVIRLSDFVITETLTETELLTKYQITF